MSTSFNLSDFSENGFAVIPNFLSLDEVNRLTKETSSILENMNVSENISIFQDQDRDKYFLDSSDKVSFFFEKDAVNEDGKLIVQKSEALNKIGHALHWLNPVFKDVTFSSKIKKIFKDFSYKNPVVVQSMIIFKHPEIGGIVCPHQDSTYLYTEPPSAMGIWIPYVDVTKENGCLWFIPGSHKKEKIFSRYVRSSNGSSLLESVGEIPTFDESLYVPVLVNKGDCVIIHGSVVHKSGKNTSAQSRPVYTFHVVKGNNHYSEQNWLQPSTTLPFPSLY